MIKAVIFDLGGVVLTHGDPGIYSYVSKVLGVNQEELINAMQKYIPDLQVNKIDERTFWKKVCSDLGINFKEEYSTVYSDQYGMCYKPNPGMKDLVSDVISAGIKTAMLSNTINSHAAYNRKMGYYDTFDVVVLSNEVGYRKPNKEIYLITLKKLGLNPQECVFTDNKEKNLVPAAELGIHTILFESPDRLRKQLNKLGLNL